MGWAPAALLLALTAGLAVAACEGDLGPTGGTGGTTTSGGSGGASSSSSTSTTSSSASTTGTGGAGGASLDCDDGFTFDPEPPGTGSYLTVSVTDASPLTYVDLTVTGPATATRWFDGVSTTDPWTWDWQVTDLAPGVWTFVFSAGEPQAPLASCQRVVLDTGPALPPPGGCDGKYCGDDDGNGGICADSPCRVVGTNLANPSPCGPSQQDSPWQTLDHASCQGGNSCRIWCPYEKCDGCPNGTEAVWVPTSETSYETACMNACQGLGACWDTQLSLCRNPGMCGQPLGQCPWQ
ncbi:MAG: hypothetical protein JRI68_08485 [Deltaproteobacteria bacterium]|nr:hypothetical protein [Deltaproteobacteria bacterium]